MKKLIGALCALLVSAQAAAGGMDFQNDSLDQALVKAKQENKMVLLVLDSDKRSAESLFMNRMLFPIHRIGNFYNDRFVNLKKKVGESADLATLAKQQGIVEFPAYLIIDRNGTVVSTEQGSKGLDEFIQFGKQALGQQLVSN